MLKKMVGILFAQVVKKSPVKIIEVLLSLFSQFETVQNRIILKLPVEKLSCIKTNLIESLKLIPDENFRGFKEKELCSAAEETIALPRVVDVSEGGKISFHRPDISLYKFDNAIVTPLSDIIKVADYAYWEKYKRKEFVKMKPLDSNILGIDQTNNKIFLRDTKKQIKVNQAFNLCGVHSIAWSHFLVSYLPKLKSLEKIAYQDELTILFPECTDEHIKYMLNSAIAEFENICVMYIGHDTEVFCNTLFHCSTVSFLCDHSEYTHISDIQISQYAVDGLRAITSKFDNKREIQNCKIYIGRDGERNVRNANEIEAFFISKGFRVIYPHKLSMNEKIEIFSKATHICGPASSGFSNVIFSKPNTKVLAFINFSRTFDPFFSQLSAAGYGFDFWFMTGDETEKSGINASYTISVSKIAEFFKEENFLNN